MYIVTGGSGGLGRATADALVADGAKVVLSGRNKESLDKAVAALGSGARSGWSPTTPTRRRLLGSRSPLDVRPAGRGADLRRRAGRRTR